MKNRFLFFILIISVLMVVLYPLRFKLMESMGNYLIKENHAIHKIEYGFVLSGNAFDRGNKAAELFYENKIEQIVCTGSNKPPALKALSIDTLESDLTKLQLLRQGIADSEIILLKEGRSTFEESNVILDYCKTHHIKEIALISSKFHTRRIDQVFYKKFKNEGIDIYIYGAPSSTFHENKWWENEYGLLAVNNEYIKQLYYLINY